MVIERSQNSEARSRKENTSSDGHGVQRRARTFEDFLVWQRADAFVLEVYRLTQKLRVEERFGPSSQLRRAGISIAEGFVKRGKADKARFLNPAPGSTQECGYFLILIRDLSLGDMTQAQSLLTETSRLLDAYTEKVRQSA
ncbi:MAG: four helix bundle protein [Opitutales bacterium]